MNVVSDCQQDVHASGQNSSLSRRRSIMSLSSLNSQSNAQVTVSEWFSHYLINPRAGEICWYKTAQFKAQRRTGHYRVSHLNIG